MVFTGCLHVVNMLLDCCLVDIQMLLECWLKASQLPSMVFKCCLHDVGIVLNDFQLLACHAHVVSPIFQMMFKSPEEISQFEIVFS